MSNNETSPPVCRICGGAPLEPAISVREMMFGTREAFDYFFCRDCGTFQIGKIPTDLARFYGGETYYSFNNRVQGPGWKRALRRFAAKGMVGRPEKFPHGRSAIDRVRKGAEPWIAHIAGLRLDSTILDVGCGEGARLESLAELGFTQLNGVDPFLPQDKVGVSARGAVTLMRSDLDDVEDRFDLITMHHSLEHFPNPLAMLATARRKLKPGGRIFVRIPLMQHSVWERYGPNWSQIDAPRHLYLFSLNSFKTASAECGLDIVASGYDGLGWSLVWSEGYSRDVAMYRADGSPNEAPLSSEEVARCNRLAVALNASGEGDQGWFVLQDA